MLTKSRLRCWTGSVLSALLLSPSFAFADHAWGNYHWARTANPFTLKLGDNLTSAWKPYLSSTSTDWNLSMILDTAVVAGGAGTAKRCRPTSGRVEVCNSTYGNTGWLGVAQIWVSGSHITQGTTKVNDTYFNTAMYNTPAWRNLVMCQEVGHTFGLNHQDENFSNVPLGTCMDYSSDPVPNQHPNGHDYDELVSMYSHLDATTTVKQTSAQGNLPPAMTDIDFATPAQWGKLIHSRNSGQSELYELDFGSGRRIFTFVIWAIGHERGRH